jgi:hypothetical protein
MKTITVEQLLKYGPCYNEETIRDLAGDKKEWTALEILALNHVPAQDRLWVVLREELVDAPILHEFACLCAESVLHMTRDADRKICRSAIETKRRWLRGDATDEELAAAWDAAWATAWAVAGAAGAAAGAAAWGAARAAAGAAAGAAAWGAARAAAWAAAGDAAWDAAWDKQVCMLVAMVIIYTHK